MTTIERGEGWVKAQGEDGDPYIWVGTDGEPGSGVYFEIGEPHCFSSTTVDWPTLRYAIEGMLLEGRSNELERLKEKQAALEFELVELQNQIYDLERG